MKVSPDINIVSLKHFIQSARDAGYRGIASAIAELVDNSFEADSKKVTIDIEKTNNGDITVVTTDDGCGMTPSVLQIALQFGGSTRFNSRRNVGRFGMGLLNSSLSQSRRLEVTTWKTRRKVWQCYLDVDEIVAGYQQNIQRPQLMNSYVTNSNSGTKVVWKKCDRIEFKNEKSFVVKLRKSLGRLFRNHIWAGKTIVVCGEIVVPIDPLFFRTSEFERAAPFGSQLDYRIEVPNVVNKSSTVTVQFAELPIETWHGLSNEQKQAKGISKSAGVSIVRAGREIDYGWFFMGKKRKENYDDWWRCEICFEPDLDELFGVSNTKQGIRPNALLTDILTQEIELTAHLLNNRARQRFAKFKAKHSLSTGERIAARRDHLLEPPEQISNMGDAVSIYGLRSPLDSIRTANGIIRGLTYRIESTRMNENSFFIPLLTEREIVILLNENHPFFQCIYSPHMGLSNRNNRLSSQHLELTLLAAGRAECTLSANDPLKVIKTMREEWSKVLATFLE